MNVFCTVCYTLIKLLKLHNTNYYYTCWEKWWEKCANILKTVMLRSCCEWIFFLFLTFSIICNTFIMKNIISGKSWEMEVDIGEKSDWKGILILKVLSRSHGHLEVIKSIKLGLPIKNLGIILTSSSFIFKTLSPSLGNSSVRVGIVQFLSAPSGHTALAQPLSHCRSILTGLLAL